MICMTEIQENETQVKKTIRLAWIDMAKGYGIILVILGHLRIGPILTQWIYTFHLPLFFFLSGYVFNDRKQSFRSFLHRKCRSMLIPYFCLGIPMLLFQALMDWHHGLFTPASFRKMVLSFLVQQRMWTLWFLACLFFLNLFFFAIKRTVKTPARMILLAVILPLTGFIYYGYGGIPLPWNIDVCLMAYPFFLAGYFYKENHSAVDQFLQKRNHSLALFLLFAAVNILGGCGSVRISGKGLEMFGSSYGFLPLTYLSAFAGTACVIILSHKSSSRPIRYIGEFSMLYFAWHQTILIPITEILLQKAGFHINAASGTMRTGLYTLTQLILILLVLTICSQLLLKAGGKGMIGK